MKFKKYRIVTDEYNGFEAQIWRIWFPFWVEIGFTNTHTTVEIAEKYIKNYSKRTVVKYVNV